MGWRTRLAAYLVLAPFAAVAGVLLQDGTRGFSLLAAPAIAGAVGAAWFRWGEDAGTPYMSGLPVAVATFAIEVAVILIAIFTLGVAGSVNFAVPP